MKINNTPLVKFINETKDKLENIFFPKYIKCVVCGIDLPKKDNHEICTRCYNEIEKISIDKCCDRCGSKLVAEEKFCYNCRNDERFFDIARSCFVYEGHIKRLIHQFKLGNKPYLSRVFAVYMVELLKDLNWKFDTITFVPTTQIKIKQRGYNQSQILACSIGKELNMQVSDLLYKVKDTTEQKELKYLDRKNNMKDCFKVIDKELVNDKNILLIDDVMTTGATASACANMLKRAGANKVFALTIAHGVVKLHTINPQKPIKIKKKPILT